jgi:hypothetical protein
LHTVHCSYRSGKLKLALEGCPASSLVVTTPAIDNLTIDRIEDDGSGSKVWLEAVWQKF